MLEAYQNKKIKKMESYLFSSRYAWGDAESGVHSCVESLRVSSSNSNSATTYSQDE